MADVAPQPSESLSSLVGGMLSARSEAKKAELAAQEQQQQDLPMPIAGPDGTYHIRTETQFRYVRFFSNVLTDWARAMCRLTFSFYPNSSFRTNRNFLNAHADEALVIKVSSPGCKACALLQQRFHQFENDARLQGASVVFADLLVSKSNISYVTSILQVTRTPSMLFYAPAASSSNSASQSQPLENFTCGPHSISWKELYEKIISFVDKYGRETVLSPHTVASPTSRRRGPSFPMRMFRNVAQRMQGGHGKHP